MPDPAAQARFFGAYAKNYHAGAFATPTRKEIEADPELVREWLGDGFGTTMVAQQVLSRDSKRKDFTGREFVLPKGSLVATHLARTPGSELPDMTEYDFIMGYIEDRELSEALESQGFGHYATRVTSASELIRVWGQDVQADAYEPVDDTTVTKLDVPMTFDERDAIFNEVAALTGYADDVPLYSDGSWGALTLRGYYPDDPGKNAKPAEQDRKWKASHPEELDLPCVWTILALECEAIVEWVSSVPWWGTLERVRLLRMTQGKLGRHTDILDRNGGTRDGEIVRFHLPIVTAPRIELHTVNLAGEAHSTHLEPWHSYYLDTRLPHAVTNPTTVGRVHLVVDVVSNEEVRSQIELGTKLA